MSLAALFSADPLTWYDPLPLFDRMHRSQARKRFVLKPNQIGGTYSWAAELWWTALDIHPYRPPVKPGPVWAMIDNMQDEYRTVCAKLREVGAPSRLHPDCRYVEQAGYVYRSTKMLVLDNGRAVEFKSGTQDVGALESGTIAALFINEPPKPGHWGAVMQRISVLESPVLMNFTAVGRPLGWLKAEIHGDPEQGVPPKDPSWEVFIGELTQEACTTVGGRVIRTEASIAAQKAATPAAQYAQRIRASWEAMSLDRVFDGYDEETEIQRIPARRWQVLLGIDHGELAGHEAALLLLWDESAPCMIILDEYVNATTSNIEEDAEGIRAMLARHDMRPRDVDAAVGDVNSAGKSAAGRTVNEQLGLELDMRIRAARKGAGSVDHGAQVLNTALRRGFLRVAPAARQAAKALRHWNGADDDFKHFIDALRYIAVAPLERAMRPTSPHLVLP